MIKHSASFNSPIEIGTRIALIITALDTKHSLDDLVLLDYALLYSEEFGGPNNLHPALPNHIAEIAHRREFMPKAINFLIKRGLIDISIEDTGHYYFMNENTLDFVSCLQSAYYKKAWARLSWMRNHRQRIVMTNVMDLAKSKL